MDWFYFAVFSAIIWGILAVTAKEIMEDTLPAIYTSLYSILGLVFYTPFFLYYISTTELNYSVLAILGLGTSIFANVTAFLLYNLSIEEGELSKVIPFTRLVPIFASVFAVLLLGESVDLTLATGILAATIGGVILLKEEHVSYLTSFEDGIHKEAIKAAVLSSAVYGLASVADRFATQVIQPEIYTFFIYLGMCSLLIGYLHRKPIEAVPELKDSFKEYPKLYTLTGLLAAAASLSIFKAFSLAPASKVTPVLQLQVLIPVISGILIFGDDGLKRKLVGTAILLTGIILVAI